MALEKKMLPLSNKEPKLSWMYTGHLALNKPKIQFSALVKIIFVGKANFNDHRLSACMWTGNLMKFLDL